MNSLLKNFGIAISFIAFVYGLILAGLYIHQDKLLFHPTPRQIYDIAEKMPLLKEINYSLPSGERVYAWYKKPQKNKQTIVYFHGNVEHAEYHLPRLKALYEAGFGLLIPEYRGFGDLKGTPSQENIEQDAVTAVKYLTSTGTTANKIVLYGHSLGTYPAVYAATQQTKPLNGVILEAPFLSVEKRAQEMYTPFVPVGLLLKNKFISENLIAQIKTRLFLAHGKQDKTIPYHHGWHLFEKALEPKLFFSSETAGHTTLPDNGLFKALIEWLDEKK